MWHKLCGALFAAVLLAGGARAQEPTIKVQDYPGLGNLLYKVAIEKGFCARHGIRCELQVIPAAALGMQALMAGSIDVALPPPEVAINAALKGVNIRIIGNATIKNPFQLLVRKDLGLPLPSNYKPVWEALKGKKIGVAARGTGAELIFIQLARLAGLRGEDFTFVAVGGPNTAYGALKSKQIDAAMSYEPLGSICEVLEDCQVAYRAQRDRDPPQVFATNGASTLLAVKQEMIDKSPKTVEAIIAAGKDASDFVNDPKNHGEVVEIARKLFVLDLPQSGKILERSLEFSLPNYRIEFSRTALSQTAKNMLEAGQLSAPFDTNTIVYSRAPGAGAGQ